MEKREFIKILGISSVSMACTNPLGPLFEGKDSSERMPVLFIGHGNPMYAIRDNDFTREWEQLGRTLPKPKAILCISAHWMTRNSTQVLAMENPKTIHDFSGFPDELFAQQYNAPGAPDFAKETQELIKTTSVGADLEQWGFDHGCWAPIQRFYPEANIPLYQLSIDINKSPQYHFDLAKDLKALRKKGVLIMGSGNIVHNLRKMVGNLEMKYDWAIEFDEKVKQLISAKDFNPLFDYNKLPGGRDSVPTNDHYLPLLYSLAVQDDKDDLTFFNDEVVNGSMSMRSLILS